MHKNEGKYKKNQKYVACKKKGLYNYKTLELDGLKEIKIRIKDIKGDLAWLK